MLARLALTNRRKGEVEDRLTCSKTRSIFHALRDASPLLISINFLGSTTLPRTLKARSPLSVSTSLLCCLFLTMAFISFGFTFLSWFHWLMRVLYCRMLERSTQTSEHRNYVNLRSRKPRRL